MKTKLSLLLFGAMLIITQTKLNAQVATGYQIGRWYQFKTAALSYTWDDLTKKQLSDALPLYNAQGFKMTFNVVSGWSADWNALLTASKNGHEIACHTVSHATLSGISIANQTTEMVNAQNAINSNITNTKCLTIAYPNCNIGDAATIAKYFIAGRTCDSKINSYSPSDFYRLGAYICGDQGVNSSTGLNQIATDAKNAGGWGVYLFHAINADGGFSPIASSVLSSHLATIKSSIADYWVGTFLNVAQYIKERNAATLTETIITTDSLKVSLTDNLDNALYFADISIRRALPNGWSGAKVYLGTTLLASSINTINNIKYVDFNVAPDKGTIYLANTAITTTPSAPTVTAAINYCQNATATALTATGTALKWYNTATGGTPLATPPVPLTNAVNVTNYYVSQTVNSIESPRATIVVTVSATPSAPSVSSPLAYQQNALATALNAAGTSLKWYTTQTGGTATSTAPVPNTSNIGSSSFYVTQTTGNCESPRAQIIVNVTNIPVKIALKTGWNMVGFPLSTNPDVATAFKSIAQQLITVKDLESFWDVNTTPILNSLSELKWGQGYYIKVSSDCDLDWNAK